MSVVLLPFRAIYRGLVWLANSPRTLILSYSLLIVVSGFLYRIFEDVSVGDAVWWAVVTASTVGYGDISPETWQARVIAAVLISTMVLLVIPLITAHFASKLIVDTDAFAHEEQEELKNNLRAGTGAAGGAGRAGGRSPGRAAQSPPAEPSDR